MITVSVIIPTFDRLPFLERAVSSVLEQQQHADEIIVIDDGSQDGTADVVRTQFPMVTLLRHDGNLGVSAARNTGIRKAKGDWLAFLDSDDEWLPTKLARQIEEIERHEGCRLIHSNEIWIRRGRRVNPMAKHAKAGGHIFRRCLPLCVISPSAVLVHHSVFQDVGVFDEALPACEDYDLWLRICSIMPVVFIDEPLILKHGGHDDQLSQRYWGMDRFRIRALQKILRNGDLDKADAEAVIATLVEKITVYLNGAKKRNKQSDILYYEQLLKNYSYG